MSLLEVKNGLVDGGLGLLILLTFIQITPIKINPLSYIARKLGEALNRTQAEKFETLKTQIEGFDTRMDGFKTQLDGLDKKVEDLKDHVSETEIRTIRTKILRFADEIFMGKVHSHDAYKEALHAINEYETYCNNHPNFVNNMAEFSIAEIKKAYELHRANHDFLMPIATIEENQEEAKEKENEKE